MMVSSLNESKDERELARNLKKISKNFQNSYFLKRVYTEWEVDRNKCETALRDYFNIELPKIFAVPDLVLVFEDYTKVEKDFFIIAIELKYFRYQKNKREVNKKLREAFREVGQPLRYLVFGYDAAVLWHVFQSELQS